jgi:serine/threonine protein phosphatase PrpC
MDRSTLPPTPKTPKTGGRKSAADAESTGVESAVSPGARLGPVTIVASAASDVGRVRAENQDNFVISDDLLLYAVADGMGGHNGGETASRLAVESLFEEIAQLTLARLTREGQAAAASIPLGRTRDSVTGQGATPQQAAALVKDGPLLYAVDPASPDSAGLAVTTPEVDAARAVTVPDPDSLTGDSPGGSLAKGRVTGKAAAFAGLTGSGAEFARAALLKGFLRANQEVYTASRTIPDLSGMGTTLTAMKIHRGTPPPDASLSQPGLTSSAPAGGAPSESTETAETIPEASGDAAYGHFAHVGDSRAYLIRAGGIVQLSDDHSLVNEHVKAGLITEAQARVSYFRNIITRSVGTERTLMVDSFSVQLEPGDIYVLCSDGLINQVEDDEILATVKNTPFEKLAGRLVDFANERGGDDNITVIALRVEASA